MSIKLITFVLEAPKILFNEYSDKYDLLTKEIEITASYSMCVQPNFNSVGNVIDYY